MQVNAAYRPAYRAAPTRPEVKPRRHAETSTLEKEAILLQRTRICRGTLQRLLPSVEQTVERRLANQRASVPQERLAKLQLQLSEQMMFTLQEELWPVKAELERTRALRGYAVPPPPPPVQLPRRPLRPAVLAHLCRPKAALAFEPGLDLHGYDFSYLDFLEASLSNACLDDCNATGANLVGVALERASLRRALLLYAVMTRALLDSACLAGADLSHAVLRGSRLPYADLSGAILRRANLSGADLRGATLDDAVPSFTTVDGCDLRGASLRGVVLAGLLGLRTCHLDNLREANLTALDMADLNLVGVDVTGALLDRPMNLRKASLDNLRGAILNGCDFSGVELGHVDLSRANLTGAHFRGARLTTPIPAKGAVVSSFPLGGGHEAFIGAGAVVWYSGFVIPVTEVHPTNQAYAYHADPKTAWGMANKVGCFLKSQCRVLVPAPAPKPQE